MRDYKDEMLEDAIHTALQYSYECVILRRVVVALAVIIGFLISGYFFV